MKTQKVSITADERWKVQFIDNGFWRVGIYRPEFSCPSDIDLLENHTCPELFVCVGGRMGILVYNGTDEYAVELNPGEAIFLTENDYHNGFAIDQEGYFLVSERTSFSTNYIDCKTKQFVKTVTT